LFFVNNNLRSIHNYLILFVNGKLPRPRKVRESSEEVAFNEGQSDPFKGKIIRKKHDTEFKHTKKNESPSEQNVDDKSKHLEDQQGSPRIELPESFFQEWKEWSLCKKSFMGKTADRFMGEIDELLSKQKTVSDHMVAKHREKVDSLTSKHEMEHEKMQPERDLEYEKWYLKRNAEWLIITMDHQEESNELGRKHRTEFQEFLHKYNLKPGQLRLNPNREHAELLLKQQNEEEVLALKQRKVSDEWLLKYSTQRGELESSKLRSNHSTELIELKSNQCKEFNNLISKHRTELTQLKFKQVEEFHELSNEIPDGVLNESLIDPKHLAKLNLSKNGSDFNEDDGPVDY
jgi:hypothetical protein